MRFTIINHYHLETARAQRGAPPAPHLLYDDSCLLSLLCAPALQVRIGVNGMIPGFEAGIRGMREGGQRRIVVPPALGPPTGPSTFFSAKQCEVFDIELISIKVCQRQQAGMFSSVKCE